MMNELYIGEEWHKITINAFVWLAIYLPFVF